MPRRPIWADCVQGSKGSTSRWLRLIKVSIRSSRTGFQSPCSQWSWRCRNRASTHGRRSRILGSIQDFTNALRLHTSLLLLPRSQHVRQSGYLITLAVGRRAASALMAPSFQPSFSIPFVDAVQHYAYIYQLLGRISLFPIIANLPSSNAGASRSSTLILPTSPRRPCRTEACPQQQPDYNAESGYARAALRRRSVPMRTIRPPREREIR